MVPQGPLREAWACQAGAAAPVEPQHCTLRRDPGPPRCQLLSETKAPGQVVPDRLAQRRSPTSPTPALSGASVDGNEGPEGLRVQEAPRSCPQTLRWRDP